MRILTLTALTALLSAPAFAADLGTYRPGTPYHSTIVPGADVCESQCAGDARCRGWNYVKALPSAPGVCEFQSSVGDPISSAVSISGVSRSAMPMPGRVIAGDTNTIRVGTAVTPKPEETRIIRQPVPAPSTAYQQARHSVQRPQTFQPMLDAQPGLVNRVQQPVVSRGPARAAPQSQQFRRVQPQVAQPQPRVTQPIPAQPVIRQGRPAIGQTIPAPQNYQPPAQPSYQAQPPYQTSQQPAQYQRTPIQQTPAQSGMPRSSVSNPIGFNQLPAGHTNLYGNLNDDVRQTPPPVTNGYARPVSPVQQTQLAGARR